MNVLLDNVNSHSIMYQYNARRVNPLKLAAFVTIQKYNQNQRTMIGNTKGKEN